MLCWGLFTSDSLEKQFGKVWQVCGGTQQILVKVGIAKTRLLLNLD